MPGRGAFGTRRQVAAAVGAGIAESLWHDGDAAGVVEGGTVDRQPLAQAVAAGVVPRDPALMHPRARSLAGDQQPRPAAAATTTGRGPSGRCASQMRQARTAASSRSRSAAPRAHELLDGLANRRLPPAFLDRFRATA